MFDKIHREITRICLLLAIGLALIAGSPGLALAWAIPAISPWGLFLGGMLIAGAVSHIMRRVLFPQLDLQAIAKRAMDDDGGNLAAALVFLGIIQVLCLLLYLNASMLRI